MREHYEQAWERLPADLQPPDLELRRAFLLGHVGAGERVLDLGCGDGAFVGAIEAAGAEAVGVDVADAALRRARARHPDLELHRAPIDGRLPLEEARFDAVWCSEVIEHVADTVNLLSEARRVLRPGGLLLVTTPRHGRLSGAWIALTRFEAHFHPLGDHLRFYTRRSLARALEELGFEDVRVRPAGGLPAARRLLLASARRPAPTSR
jgi:SAM-dependent methyltransferase